MKYRKNLFIALTLPPDIQKELLSMAVFFPERKFSTNPHLTLYFIGSESCIDAYPSALEQIKGKAFSLKLGSLGTFGNRVLWAGLEPSDALSELQQSITLKISALGHKIEKRAYNPHITLCRLKSPLNAVERQSINKIKCTGSWQVEDFCFFESTLLPGGAVHKIIRSFPLGIGK